MAAVNRRTAFTASVLFGAGAFASRAVTPAVAQSRAPTGGNSAPAPATHYGPPSATGRVGEVYQKARQALYPVCRVCPQCNGVACAGEMFPGIGGIGTGMSFQNNFAALQRVQLKMRPLSGNTHPDTSTVIFGQKISFPALAAPLGGVISSFPNIRVFTEPQYYDVIIGGCVDAGTLGAVGDIQIEPWEATKANYDVVARYPTKVLAGIKPRPNEHLIRIIRLAEAAKASMITIDIDSAGRGWQHTGSNESNVEPKTVAQLRELVKATDIPIVIKGIMSPDDALKAAEAGAAGICVSNHGGRVLDHTPGTADVLPGIADKVKSKMVILVDGCVHYGTDVLKYLALGADAVLVGRHLWRAAHGGGREGVALFMQTMQEELTAAMVLTAVPNVAAINRDILA